MSYEIDLRSLLVNNLKCETKITYFLFHIFIFYNIGKIDFLSKIAAKSVQKWLKCIYKQMFEYYNILTRR